jgi:xanthine dehydrogenase YagS FAD-binding subunit
MIDFELFRPKGLREAVAALAEGDADRSVMVLAGGQDLLTELKEHLVEPKRVVDLSALPELAGLEVRADGSVRIGANTTLDQLVRHAELRTRLPGLVEAAESVASPQIRSVATVGGNLNQRPRCWYYRSEDALCLKKGGSVCFAANGMSKYNAILGGGPSYIVHPSDLAPMLVALEATVNLVGPNGSRSVPLSEYYLLPSEGDLLTETRRLPGEVMVDVVLPAARSGLKTHYLKFKERESYDWALAAVAVAAVVENGALRYGRMVLGGVAPKPWSVPIEKILGSTKLDEESIARIADASVADAKPLAHNGYKVPLVRGLVTRALRTLA